MAIRLASDLANDGVDGRSIALLFTVGVIIEDVSCPPQPMQNLPFPDRPQLLQVVGIGMIRISDQKGRGSLEMAHRSADPSPAIYKKLNGKWTKFW